MTNDDVTAVRARLDDLAEAAPPVGFVPDQVVVRARRVRRRRTGLAVAGSAAALALVVAVPAIALRSDGRSATTSTSQSAVPGIGTVPAGEAEQIVRECTSSPSGLGPRPGLEEARLYNIVRDRYGTLALVIGRKIMLDCVSSPRGFVPSGGGEDGAAAGDSLAWLPGPIAVDLTEGGVPGGWMSIAGRVSAAVASVVVRFGDQSRRVSPVDGTFLVRFPSPTAMVEHTAPAGTVKDASLAATAYDGRGRVLGTWPGAGAICVTAPGGGVVMETPSPASRCVPAVRWR